MNKKELESKLMKEFRRDPPPNEKEVITLPDDARLEKTIRLAKQEYAAYRKRKERIGFAGFVLRQAKYAGKRMWAVQGLLTLLYLAAGIYGVRRSHYLELTDMINRHGAFVLCSFAFLICAAVYPVIYRSVRDRMYEVEAAAYFSGIGLLKANMILNVAGAVPVLGTVFLFSPYGTGIGGFGSALFLIVPYLTAYNGGLYVLTHIREERRGTVIAAGGFMGFLILLLCDLYFPAFYAPEARPVWFAAGIVTAIAGAVQQNGMNRKERNGGIEWNLQ